MNDDEECVGAVIEGRVPDLIDRPPPEPFVAMLSFAALGPLAEKVYPDGRTRAFRPVLGESRRPFG